MCDIKNHLINKYILDTIACRYHVDPMQTQSGHSVDATQALCGHHTKCTMLYPQSACSGTGVFPLWSLTKCLVVNENWNKVIETITSGLIPSAFSHLITAIAPFYYA